MWNEKRLLLTAMAFVLLLFIGQLGYYGYVGYPADTETTFPDRATSYSLTDDRGKPLTENALRGHPSLVYFGYTHCPDVCPTTLYEMTGWFKTLGSDAGDLRAYFFSVDPERDTAQLMHTYISNFTDKIIGVTGRADEMQKAVKAWHIYAKKVPSPDGDGDYTMDHTASVMLVDSNGNLKSTIAYGEDGNIAVGKIRNLLKAGR